jgi:hypothetical protein
VGVHGFWSCGAYTPTRPDGGPAGLPQDGTALHDRVAPSFTLVGFAGDGSVGELLQAEAAQGLTVTHTVVDDPVRGTAKIATSLNARASPSPAPGHWGGCGRRVDFTYYGRSEELRNGIRCPSGRRFSVSTPEAAR